MFNRLSMLAGALLVTTSLALPAIADEVVHHHKNFGNAFLSNSYIIESENGLVVIDPPFTVSSSQSLLLQMKTLNKPLLGIISTHHHPDHRFGGMIIAEGKADTPYYVEEGVNQWTVDTDQAKYEYWSGIFGAEIPAERMLPNKTLKDGEQMTIDGLTYEVRVSGEEESHHSTHWLVKMTNGSTYAFIGDTAMPDFHAWLADGHTKNWVENVLPAMKASLGEAGVKRVFVGHGNSGGLEVFDWQEDYIRTYWAHLTELTADGALDDADKAELTTRMIAHAGTENEAGLVAFSAETVAKELGLIQ